MEDSKKKPIMIAAIMVCLGVAGAITYFASHSGSSDIGDISSDQMTWIKCSNPECDAEYQMGFRDYYEQLKETEKGDQVGTAPACKECGENSIYAAIKCGQCGLVFYPGAAVSTYQDTCPECSYSDVETKRKAARERQG